MKTTVLALLASALSLPLRAADPPPDHFKVYASGARSVTLSGGATDTKMESLHLEWARPISRRTEVGAIVAPHLVQQPNGGDDETVRAASLSLFVRRRFLLDRRVNLYAELGTGPFWSDRRIPAKTARFNFASQFGFGAILFPRSRTPLFAGYREFHISNAGSAPRNPGLDLAAIVFGIQLAPRR